ncbi:hypothetical protein LNTAR_05506 [Lentisphaera araneosa HTCC2155]|uniref:Uncharacterized protein n=1 Tax=Lentisphaera araneosa HTCC2155 TaxID=313628 RepID=A6DLT8_9BACT|nr:hypothetical protein LNTAR_05506 [Lentisphaera araneosa HTCC2155]
MVTPLKIPCTLVPENLLSPRGLNLFAIITNSPKRDQQKNNQVISDLVILHSLSINVN